MAQAELKQEQAAGPWNEAQIADWYRGVMAAGKKRDYVGSVVARLMGLPANTHTVERYGIITSKDETYTGLRALVGDLHNGKPNILIMGGTHGYEPSGVEAVIRFLQKDAARLSDKFNFLAYPAISPWAYEYDQRWNWRAEDVNRNFSRTPGIVQIEECTAFMTDIENLGASFALAIDLHETNDRDRQLRVERAQRFGNPMPTEAEIEAMPQGFHLMLSSGRTAWQTELQREFGQSIINKVAHVSPIAPEEKILGIKNEGGLLISPAKEGLTRHFLASHAHLVAVTEVCPDLSSMDPEKAIETQRAAIFGALDYLMAA